MVLAMPTPLTSNAQLCYTIGVETKQGENKPMETEYMFNRRQEEIRKRKELVETIKEIVGGILFFAMLFVFCALCTICSGYHWE